MRKLVVLSVSALMLLGAVVFNVFPSYQDSTQVREATEVCEATSETVPEVVVQVEDAEAAEPIVEEPQVTEQEAPEPVVEEYRDHNGEEETSRGGARHYTLRVQVTAYSPYDEGVSGICTDGTPAVPYESMAVDTDVIPLGSVVVVPGLGTFVAHDTGGAIRGNIVDVYLPTKAACFDWGRQYVNVTVYPPK